MTGSTCRVLVRRLGRVSYSEGLTLQNLLATKYKAVSPPDPVSCEIELQTHKVCSTHSGKQTLCGWNQLGLEHVVVLS